MKSQRRNGIQQLSHCLEVVRMSREKESRLRMLEVPKAQNSLGKRFGLRSRMVS